jgi:hypothetical protein
MEMDSPYQNFVVALIELPTGNFTAFMTLLKLNNRNKMLKLFPMENPFFLPEVSLD